MKNGKLDQVDLSIIEILQKDANLTMVELAKALSEKDRKLARHASGVADRVSDLIAHDYVKIKALADPAKLGLDVVVLVSLELNNRRGMTIDASNTAFENEINASFPTVVECMKVMGSTDYILKIVAPDPVSYDSVLKRITDIPGVKSVE